MRWTALALAGSLALAPSPVSAGYSRNNVMVIVHRGDILIKRVNGAMSKCYRQANNIRRIHKFNTTRESTIFCDYFYGEKDPETTLYFSGPEVNYGNFYFDGTVSECNALGKKLKQKIIANTPLTTIHHHCVY